LPSGRHAGLPSNSFALKFTINQTNLSVMEIVSGTTSSSSSSGERSGDSCSKSERKRLFRRRGRLDKSQGDLAKPKCSGDKQEKHNHMLFIQYNSQLCSKRLISNVAHLIITPPLQSVFNLTFLLLSLEYDCIHIAHVWRGGKRRRER